MRRADEVESLDPLTSLRFVAAMMIVMYHSKLYFPWGRTHAPDTFVQGVSFFFVLSGFILTHVYTSKPFPGYAQFMRARFARLWPVHIFALLALVTFVRPDSITFDGPGLFSKWVTLATNLTLTQSLVPLQSFQFSWNAVSWSISTEMCFYLAFPFLLTNIRRNWHLKLAGAVALFLMVIVLVVALHLPIQGDANQLTQLSMVYTNPLARGFEFCLGMATWVLWDRYVKPLKLRLLAWTAIELAVLVALALWMWFGFFMLAPHLRIDGLRPAFEQSGSCWLFAILIAVIASGHGVIGKMLSVRPLIYLGQISFSIYMVHQPLMKFFSGWLPAGATTPTMVFAAIFFIASGTFVMIEKPAQRFLMRGLKARVEATARRPLPSR